MSTSQNSVDPSHPSDAAMLREQAGNPSTGSYLTSEELASMSQFSPADLVAGLANSHAEVPRNSPLHQMSSDALRNEMTKAMSAIQDFRGAQASINRLEAKAATSNDVNGILGRPAFDSQGHAILDLEGTEYEKASRAADQSRRSAARAGVGDREYDWAVAQLESTNPNANANQGPPADVAEIQENSDGTLRVKLQTGEVFAGDPRRIIDAMSKSYVHGKRWAQGLKQQLKEQPTNAPSMQPATQPSMDSLITDPEIAERFARSVGFSGAQEMVEDYQRTQQQLAEMQSKLEAANQFASEYQNQKVSEAFIQQCPDFPGDERSINELMRVMDASDLSYENPANLALAHQFAIKQHFYEPLRADEIAATYQPQGQQTSSRTPPPQPPPQNSPSHDDGANPWSLSTDELKRRVLSGGGLGKALLNMEPGSTFGV